MQVNTQFLSNIAILVLASFILFYVMKLSLGIEIKNTLIYWWMIGVSVYISLKYLKNWKWIPIVFVSLFIVLEVIYYTMRVNIWNENEKVRDLYNIMFRFLPKDGVHTQAADLTEGYFKCNYEGTSADQAMKNKYDKIYELLKLEPGMRVIDLGCGHGQWMTYLRERGVTATGVTLSNDQYNNLKKKGFEVHLGDFTKLPSSFYGKYDAISAIGSFEHVPKDWMSYEYAKNYMTHVMKKHQLLFKRESPSKRLFMSVISFDSEHQWSFKDVATFYVLERTTSGFYYYDYEFKNMAESTMDYKTEAVAKLTEDYRYISVVNKNHFGDADYELDISKVLFFVGLMMYDPFWIHRIATVFFKPWMWQFGGNGKNVIPNDVARPCMLGWYVFKYEPHVAKGAFQGTCNQA